MKLFFTTMAVIVTVQAQEPIRGFAPSQWAAQHALENRIRLLPDAERARTYMKRMAAEPHHAGSPESKAVADYALGLFREWGLDARIEEFEALLPYPTTRSLEMTAPVKWRARLQEPALKEDPDSKDDHQLPTYNAYSASGDVTGPLVYVNYGIPADYEALKKLNIDVRGKIVIARYGQSWRGTKAKVAQENGAIGCLIYSDPKDDGYWQGDVFPKGPFRPSESVQRGSVMDMPIAVGDPLSPGWASEKGSRRLRRHEASTVMKIPVLPISYADAQPMLAQLTGPVAPAEWRGALPLTYHIGPGPATLRLKADFDWSSKPLHNVIARIPGAKFPEEWILYGNHHDAWVNGASDPISGAVALMETARSFAELRKQGWQPARTLLFALWDGEEFGLVGSTEWVEKHQSELKTKLVAYLNSDSNTGGRFSAGGSFVLEQFLREVARDVHDPQTQRSLLAVAEERPGPQGKPRPFELSPLGAGSDYVAFVHNAGIPSLNLGFSKPGSSGTYHSIYDSIAWYSTHMDPGFQYARALAHVTATAILRLSEASLLPVEFRAVERQVRRWSEEIAKTHKLDLSQVTQELDRLRASASRYEEAIEKLRSLSQDELAALNRILIEAERSLTREQGLPGRPFYRHQLYAPGLYTGYSARTLPGIREDADAGRLDSARQQVSVLAQTLANFRLLADRAVQATSK